LEANVNELRGERVRSQVRLQASTLGWILLGVAMAASVALLAWVLHDAPYVEDEWGLLLRAQDGSLRDLFAPWNGHLLAVGLALAKLSVAVAGSQVWLLVTLDIVGVLVCSLLVYLFARRRLGPILALAPALVPLFFAGSSTFYGTGIQLTPLLGVNGVYSLDFGLAALLLLEREDRLGDVLATAMLVLSLASFSYGIAFVAGVGAAVLLSPRRWQRAYVVAIPVLLYGAWLLWSADERTGTSEVLAKNVYLVPLYVSDSLSAVSAGMFGLQTQIGRGPAIAFATQSSDLGDLDLPLFLIAAETLAIVLVVRMLGRRGLSRASLWPPLVTLLALWTLQGLVMNEASRMPGDPRYLFAGAVLLAVVAAELARGIRFKRFAAGVILAMAVLGAIANVPRFREGKQLNGHVLQATQAAAAVIELAGKNVDPEFVPARDVPAQIKTMWIGAADYQEFANRNGSLAIPLSQLRGGSEFQRAAADRTLVRSLDIRLAQGGLPPGADCVGLASSGKLTPSVERFYVRSSGGGVVTLRRFGDREVPVGSLSPNRFAELEIPADRATRTPWILSVGGGEPMTVCSPSNG
jgi:hypothetical protein